MTFKKNKGDFRMICGDGLLADGMAHNFGNLLQLINGSALMALDLDEGNEEQRREIENILEASNRGSRLLKKMLSLNREPQLDPLPLDLNRLVSKFMELFGSSIKNHIFCQLRLAPSIEPTFADPDAVEQILLNLVFIASDAMADGGMLVVETENVTNTKCAVFGFQPPSSRKFVRMTVTDSGCGIPPNVMDRIFDPYFTTNPPPQKLWNGIVNGAGPVAGAKWGNQGRKLARQKHQPSRIPTGFRGSCFGVINQFKPFRPDFGGNQ